jgi:hypothetical protein
LTRSNNPFYFYLPLYSISPVFFIVIMSKRHNRKRTRSRPRHRDGGKAARSLYQPGAESVGTSSSSSTTAFASAFNPLPFPLAVPTTDIWHPTYSAWHTRLRVEQELALEVQRLRFFGGEAGDEISLFEPMLKVVTDLFDGNIDYEDP